MLANAPEIEVVGTARSGREALAALETARPDVICTEYQMPEMDGLELIQHIMARFPRPILVMGSRLDPADREQVFPLLAAGAVDVIAKPDASHALEQAAALVQKIKLLSGVVVIARRLPVGAQIPEPDAASPVASHAAPPRDFRGNSARATTGKRLFQESLPPETTREAVPRPALHGAGAPVAWPAPPTSETTRIAPQNALETQPAPRAARRAAIALASGAGSETPAPPLLRVYQAHPIRMVTIGASTGGPQTLHALFARLPLLPCPILCVQHISAGFLQGLVDWLHDAGRARVKIAEHGEIAAPGTIYFPPEGAHLEIDAKGRLSHSPAPPVGGHRPAITVTFESVARAYGHNSVGVLLTGMGCDGAAGLETLMLAGSATIAQDEASSVVFGMPKQAIARGAAHFVLPGDQIADKIARLVLTG